jgi:hypothetical protein
MCRIRALTGPVVLGALFATTPQLAFGQEGDDEESPVEITCRKCIVGNEIASDQLGEFIAKNLNVKFMAKKDEGLVWVGLRLEMISREEGVIGKYESETVEVELGKTYSASTWVSQRDRYEASLFPKGTSLLAPGFGDRRKITLGPFVIINLEEMTVPRECEGASHAVRITLVSDDRLFWEPTKPINFICLNVER